MTLPVKIARRQDLPQAPPEYDAGEQQLLRTALERALDDLALPASPEKYTLTTSPEARDADAVVTLADTIDIVQTLIHDLRSKGLLS